MPPTTPLQQGIDALKAGNVDLAIEYLEQATAANPSDFQGFNCLGIAYAKKQLYNRAVGAFLVAIKLRPGVASIHYNIGLACQADGLPDRAREEFRKALQIDPAYRNADEALKQLDLQGEDMSARACARHTEEPAVGFCSFCHLAMCEQCRTTLRGEAVCTFCAEKLTKR